MPTILSSEDLTNAGDSPRGGSKTNANVTPRLISKFQLTWFHYKHYFEINFTEIDLGKLTRVSVSILCLWSAGTLHPMGLGQLSEYLILLSIRTFRVSDPTPSLKRVKSPFSSDQFFFLKE